MAKKMVRGITDVKTITNQDFDTNNVNDLLSDGEYNYIHRKKGKNEEYHNLTDNIKTISSDNTDLLSVTNYNKTTNTATLHPKHDTQKEQVIESTRDTIAIHHGTNGTAEKTTVDTNPKKVLEHEKLKTGDGLGTLFNNDETTIILKPTPTEDLPAKNGLYYGNVTKDGAQYSAISLNVDPNKYIQLAFRNSVGSPNKMVGKYRYIINNVPTEWQQMLVDDEDIRLLLSQKQNKLTAGDGITIQGNTISASGATLTVQNFASGNYNAKKYVLQSGDVQSGYDVLTTFVFNCFNSAETVLTGELKEELEEFIPQTLSISSGALSIKRDGADIKLINSAPSENVIQHATFTFNDYVLPGGGGGGGGSAV